MINKRNYQRRMRLWPSLLLATASLAGSASAETELVFAEDISVGKRGVNSVERQVYPKSQAKGEEFKQRLGGVDAVDFESVNLGSYTAERKNISTGKPDAKSAFSEYKLAGKPPIKLDFGDGEHATLDGMTSVQTLSDKTKTFMGGFPTSGETFMGLISGSGTVKSTITFSHPQGAFGFYVTDIERNTFQIELVRDGQANEVIKVPCFIPQNSGGVCFVGVINKDKPFNGVKFDNVGGASEGFGFDDMMIAKPHEIKDPTPPAINARGDVHFSTPDGLVFDYHGFGDFVSIQSEDRSVILQARQQPYSVNTKASITTALALQVGDDRVAFYVKPKLRITVDGKDKDVSETLTLTDGGTIEPQGGTGNAKEFLIYWPERYFVTRVIIRGTSHMDYGVKKLLGSQGYAGILGNLDGDAKNDMQVRDGKVISAPASVAGINQFGDSWRVQGSSLFEDPADHKGAHTVANIDPAKQAEAEKAVKAAGITEPLAVREAVFDVAITNDKSFLESAKEFQKAIKALPAAKRKFVAGDLASKQAVDASTNVAPAADRLTGIWAPVGESGSLEFKNGTFVGGGDPDDPEKGTYKVEGGQIIITTDEGQSREFPIEFVDANTINLDDLVFKRIGAATEDDAWARLDAAIQEVAAGKSDFGKVIKTFENAVNADEFTNAEGGQLEEQLHRLEAISHEDEKALLRVWKEIQQRIRKGQETGE